MSKSVIKVSIVEDNTEMQNFLISAFKDTEDIVYLQSYKNAEEAVAFLPKSDADAVIVDIGLPGESGIECVRKVKELRPDIQFLMYTVFDQDDKIFESLKSGASGYLIKSPKEELVISAVREMMSGDAPMSPAIARKVISFFYNKNKFKELKLLSAREKEVLELLAQGLLYQRNCR